MRERRSETYYKGGFAESIPLRLAGLGGTGFLGERFCGGAQHEGSGLPGWMDWTIPAMGSAAQSLAGGRARGVKPGLSRRGGAAETVVDGRSKPCVRNGRNGNAGCTAGLGHVQSFKQAGSSFNQISLRA